MPDISRDVEVKISQQTIGDGLKKVGADSKAGAKSVGDLQRSIDANANSWKKLAEMTKGAFVDAIKGPKEAGAALDTMGRKLDETTKKVGLLSKAWNGMKGGNAGIEDVAGRQALGRYGAKGALVSGGMSATSGMLGGMLGGALIGGPAGAAVSGLSSFGEAWVEDMSGHKKKKLLEQAQEHDLAKFSIANDAESKITSATAHSFDEQVAAKQQTAAAMTYNPFGKTDSRDLALAQIKNLQEQGAAIQGRVDSGGKPITDLQARRDAAAARGVSERQKEEEVRKLVTGDKDPAAWKKALGNATLATYEAAGSKPKTRIGQHEDAARAADTERIKLAEQLASLDKQMVDDRTKLASLGKEELAIAKQLGDTKRSEIKAGRKQFSQLSPMEQGRAIDLGGRLRKGERLEGAELEEAKGYAPLADLVEKQQLSDPEMNRQYAQFVAQTGSATDQAAAQKAIAAGTFNVELYIDEKALAKELAEQVGVKIRSLEDDTKRLVKDNAAAKDAKADAQAAANAANR